jgi:hypothetical protein
MDDERLDSWRGQWRRVHIGLRRVENIYEGRQEPEGTAGAYYDVFAFFITCYHLADWIESDEDLPASVSSEARSHVRTSNDLRMCADLANRSKHSALTRSPWTGDPSSGPSGNDVSIVVGEENVRHRFRVTSAGKEQDVLELARACVASWEAFLRRHELA